MDNELEKAELEAAKSQATALGVSYHPSIGLEKLQEKIASAIEENEAPAEIVEAPVKAAKKLSEAEIKLAVRKKATALHRVIITSMNPNKSQWQGEVFTTGNAAVPTIKRMVPFGVEWHVEDMLLNMIEERQFQSFSTKKGPGGTVVNTSGLIKEFAVNRLAPLTEKEIKELAQRQAMAAGTSA
jgi:hypothetical protein